MRLEKIGKYRGFVIEGLVLKDLYCKRSDDDTNSVMVAAETGSERTRFARRITTGSQGLSLLNVREILFGSKNAKRQSAGSLPQGRSYSASTMRSGESQMR